MTHFVRNRSLIVSLFSEFALSQDSEPCRLAQRVPMGGDADCAVAASAHAAVPRTHTFCVRASDVHSLYILPLASHPCFYSHSDACNGMRIVPPLPSPLSPTVDGSGLTGEVSLRTGVEMRTNAVAMLKVL